MSNSRNTLGRQKRNNRPRCQQPRNEHNLQVHSKTSFNCIQVSGDVNGNHPATTHTQTIHNIRETARNTRPRKRCRKRTDTANAWHISIAMKKNNNTVLSPFETRTLNHMAAPRASHTRPDKKCLNTCVPGSGTAKICCTFEQQTVTCGGTHARNADTTQTAGTHDTTDSRAHKNVTSVRTLQQRLLQKNGRNRTKCPGTAVFDDN